MHNRPGMLVVIAGLALVLGGCSLAPRYERPEAPVPAAWPQHGEAAGYQADATDATTLAWRAFFPDEKLAQVIDLALRNNRDLKLASLNVARAQALYGVQRAELFPGIGVSGAGSKKRNAADFTMPGADRTSKAFHLDLGIAAWEIDFFGRIRSLEEQALQDYLATEEAARSARIALISGVAKAYLNLAASRDLLALSRTVLEVQEDSYTLVRRWYDTGLATALDLGRADVPVQTARRDIARYTILESQAINALTLLAGESVPRKLLPKGLHSLVPPRTVTPGLPSETLLQRPDILAAEHRLQGGYAVIGAARAAFFPSISLTTTVGTASKELADLFSSGSGTWAFTPMVNMPIFDPRIWAAYRVSKAQQKILLTEYERTIQVAFREVADALAVQEQIGQQIEAQETLVQSLDTTYRLANKRYEQGIDSYFGVLDAQRSLVVAQQELTALQQTRLANEVQLYAVLGGGADEGSQNPVEH